MSVHHKVYAGPCVVVSGARTGKDVPEAFYDRMSSLAGTGVPANDTKRLWFRSNVSNEDGWTMGRYSGDDVQPLAVDAALIAGAVERFEKRHAAEIGYLRDAFDSVTVGWFVVGWWD